MRRLALAAALCVVAGIACAEERPLWELGAGGFAFAQPDYRGADEGRGYVLPIPYVAYRGDRFRVDREGIRGLLFESDRVEFDLSLFATPPVKSNDNTARAGMNDLDPTIEIVCQCKGGVRSAKAAAFLRQQGFTNVRNLTGGIIAWAEQVDLSMPKY